MEKGLLIKYGEIAIKGNNRYQFENVLIMNIKHALTPIGDFWISKEQGRFLVEPREELPETWVREAVERAGKVFGVIGVSPVDVFDDDSIESLKQMTLDHIRREYAPDEQYSFKIEARRANKKYPMTSMEIASALGEAVLNEIPGWTVDVHEPQVKVFCELRNRVYVYSRTYPGCGGMPVGTGGKATLLLSGGIDSPVAGWMMAKRGVELSAVYFHAHPYTTDRARDKVLELARRISLYAGPIRVYVVPFTEIQLDIYEKCPHEQLTIIMRRAMMWIAERIADLEGAKALITGESLGQVASQTMASLYCTNAAADLPVFRPVIGFDKQDIVEIAEKIDTFETSILPYEDCCTIFVAKHPETKPKLERILKSESHLDQIDSQIDTAVRDSEIYIARPNGVIKL
ncbi:MAG: tRNA 4-thiouridine(8) synthase ThiI [Clostridiales bacterium]|nr:tRNA 4-thiouridine(8) synthase ThiI [Clostridiales bacterium]